MTGSPPSVHDSQVASTSKQSGSGDGNSSGSRFLALGSAGVVLLSVALSSIGYGILPAQMRIHWTLGMGPYYGPEFAPTLAVLSGFPVLIGGLALGTYWLDTLLRRIEEFAAIRPYYAIGMVGALGFLVVFQGALIVANL